MLKTPPLLSLSLSRTILPSRTRLTTPISSTTRSLSTRSLFPLGPTFRSAFLSRPIPTTSPLLRRLPRNLRLNSTHHAPSPPPPPPPPQQSLSLSERMKQMSKKYGWTVVGIYLALSALDFPFCFMAVRLLGTRRIAEAEDAVVGAFWSALEKVAPSLKERREKKEAEETGEEMGGEGGLVREVAHAAGHGDASIWTQLLLAYGVHKSLLFIRIPITIAITPRVVKVLRGWGWKIGKSAT